MKRLCLFTLLWATSPALANNDGDNATENIARVVPYDGVLDLDGASFNGPVDMIFTLYDAADGGAVVWSETWSTEEARAVQVTAGRFSVNLGTYEDIEVVIADAGQVYLGLEVKRPEAADYTTLAGRQRLNPVPYALWGARASNLAVAGELTVGGDAVLGQNLSVAGAVSINGATTIDNNVNGARFLVKDNDTGNYIRLASHFDGYLQMGANGSFGGGLRLQMPFRAVQAVTLESTLSVSGATTMAGNLNLTSNRLLMNDGNGNINALAWTNNQLRLGTANRFGNGVYIPTALEVDGAVSLDSSVAIGDDAAIRGDVAIGGGLAVDGAIETDTAMTFTVGNRSRTFRGITYSTEVSQSGSGNRLLDVDTTNTVCFLTHVGGVENGQSCTISDV
ncbi:MAG: hypothetical protein KC549_18595, partial [Myxococcales bacterium]|nr:hypothetical protein [Myxococcales bacterium]